MDAYPDLLRIINGITANGGMPPIHERHVAIYELLKDDDKELPFARSSVSGESCAENDMANTYFKRASDPNFKRLCQEFKANPKAYYNKFKKMNPVFHEVVEPQKVNLETYTCLFNEDWSVADHEYMPEFYPRFPKEFKKGNVEMLERWAKREMLTARPGATPENLLDGFESVEDAMNYMIYKTPYFGGPGPKGRVGLAWRDVMAGKSIRPDQDADNGRVLGYFQNGEFVPAESFNAKKTNERKKEKKGPESPMVVVWPSGAISSTFKAEKTESCPDCEKEKKADSRDDLDEFPDF